MLAFTEHVQPRGISGYDLSAERAEVEGVSRLVQARGLTGLTPGTIEHISLVVEYLSLVVEYLIVETHHRTHQPSGRISVSRFLRARGLTRLTPR